MTNLSILFLSMWVSSSMILLNVAGFSSLNLPRPKQAPSTKSSSRRHLGIFGTQRSSSEQNSLSYSGSSSRLSATENDDKEDDEKKKKTGANFNQPEQDNFFPTSASSARNNSSEESASIEDSSPTTTAKDDGVKAAASKRQMLGFAIPALGIYLSNPLLSNIDNAFVGQTVGTRGLAALSPATICTDQMLYLFSFLSRATTGLVSRAYGAKSEKEVGDTVAAKEAGSPPLSAALTCGFALSIFYAIGTPKLLALLNVNPTLRASAASYIYWRGAIAWAALSQSVCLSIMMATRDSITPLKIIGLSALVNVFGDYLLCVWPLRWGCSGAAAATAFATLFSSGCMVQALRKKNILPTIRIPTKKQVWGLLEFTGPLLAITITRLIGFINMQRTAMRFGVQHTAAYQLSINLVLFFLLFGEPLSQLSQTKLPALVDSQSNPSSSDKEDLAPVLRSTFQSVLFLGACTALGIGSIAGLMLRFGSGLFSSDIAVQALAKSASPAVFLTVAVAIFAVTVDGAMMASRQFGFMLGQGLTTMFLQLFLLKNWCTNISQIYHTFSLRLGSYALFAVMRTALGKGALGRAIRGRSNVARADDLLNGLGGKVNGDAAPYQVATRSGSSRQDR